MTFDSHIFISYGHVDNLPTPAEDGWVTRFEKFLEAYLSAEIGEAARIWRDEQLAGNEVFPEEILKQLGRTAAVLTIVSARYIESGWCRREAEAFGRAAALSGGLVVDNRMRLFQIMLKPLKEEDRRKLPPPLDQALGYEFYREVEGGRYERLDPSFGSSEAYKRRIAQLAADVGDLIAIMRKTGPSRAAPERRCPVVYLAECGHDRIELRDRIRAELTAHGYMVVPEQPSSLSDVEAEYAGEVSRLLNESHLAVHIIGAYPGKTPDGPRRTPVVELQNQLAAEQSAARGLPRLIWIPEETTASGWTFPGELQRSAEMQRGADVVTGDIEELKSAIRTALARLEEPSSNRGAAADTRRRTVYLICVEQDVAGAVGPLAQFLDRQGLNCEFPVFTGAAGEVRSANEAVAARCDAAVIFCGAGEGAWIHAQQEALTRAQAGRRDHPMRGVYYYLAGPATADKQKLTWRGNAINALAGFSESAIEPLLRALADPSPKA